MHKSGNADSDIDEYLIIIFILTFTLHAIKSKPKHLQLRNYDQGLES